MLKFEVGDYVSTTLFLDGEVMRGFVMYSEIDENGSGPYWVLYNPNKENIHADTGMFWFTAEELLYYEKKKI